MRSLGIDLGTRRVALAERGRVLPTGEHGLKDALSVLGIDPAAVDAILATPADAPEPVIVRSRAAGIARVRAVPAPIAIALCARESGRFGVVRIGASRSELSIVERARRVALVFHQAIPVGGADVDRALARLVAERVRWETGWDLERCSPEVAARLVRECERAKVRLARDEVTSIDVAHADPEGPTQPSTIGLDRRRLAELARLALAPVLEAPRAPRVEAVIVAGRAALLPGLADAIGDRWEAPARLEPEAAAIGASLCHAAPEGLGLRALAGH